MPEFDIDQLKKAWQTQNARPQYDKSDIEKMLNKKSRNYVKYILWISIAEFAVILLINLYYLFLGDDTSSFLSTIQKLGIKKTFEVEKNFAHLYFGLKTVSLSITGIFVLLFYRNYCRINVESNLKKFILQVIRFKRTVQAFILVNILLLIVYTAILTWFIFRVVAAQQVVMSSSTMWSFIAGLVIMLIISGGIILLYYRLVYGIIMGRLDRNLHQLKEIESQTEFS